MRNLLKLLTLSAAAVSVAGCAYGGLGSGYGSPYGYDSYGYGSPYGYGGYGGSGVSVSVGYNSGYGGYGGYGSPYGYGYGSPYYGGGYYGSPYFGWYNNCYYPGSGNYVYDQYRRPRVWTQAEQAYWSGRKRTYDAAAVKQGQQPPRAEANWSAFDRNAIRDRVAQSRARTADTQAVVRERATQARVATPTQQATPTRERVRSDRSERVKSRAERRERRGNRDDD